MSAMERRQHFIDLGLSKRTAGALAFHTNFDSLRELIAAMTTPEAVGLLKGVGPKAIAEIAVLAWSTGALKPWKKDDL